MSSEDWTSGGKLGFWSVLKYLHRKHIKLLDFNFPIGPMELIIQTHATHGISNERVDIKSI